jgi:uncharacterized damage-inducible protein DinB
MSRTLLVNALPGYEAEIGRWLWAMEEVRRRTFNLVKGLDQRALDWEGPDGRENAIGSLLYHIADVEMWWLHAAVLHTPISVGVAGLFPFAPRDAHGRLARVLGVPREDHRHRLRRVRRILLDAFRGMSVRHFRKLRTSKTYPRAVAPEWVVFHLVEHEAGHAFQISALKARAARYFVSVGQAEAVGIIAVPGGKTDKGLYGAYALPTLSPEVRRGCRPEPRL